VIRSIAKTSAGSSCSSVMNVEAASFGLLNARPTTTECPSLSFLTE
jgi:hypothetical protein